MPPPVLSPTTNFTTPFDASILCRIHSSQGIQALFPRLRFPLLTGRDVQARDVIVGDVVEVLAKAADGVTMCRNQNALAALDGGDNIRVPRRQEAVLRQLRVNTIGSSLYVLHTSITVSQ